MPPPSTPDQHTIPPDADKARVQRLIDEHLFSVVFQPIFDLRTQQPVAFEALTRPADHAGFDSPADLFEAADHAGMHWHLEMATRRAALEAARDWPEHLQLFLNCSPEVLEDEHFETIFAEELLRTPCRCASQVVIEITERSPHLDMSLLPDRVDALRRRGFQIAIDDVGIGASGLVRISAIRPGWLKLDRALIQGITRDRFKFNLVRHFVQFARSCSVQVIAEGIENADELQACSDLGICFGQGFFLGLPTSKPLEVTSTLAPSAPAPARKSNAPHPGQGLSLLRGIQPALTIDGAEPITLAAQRLLRDPNLPGLCVIRGDSLLGWLARDEALATSGDDRRASMASHMLARRTLTASIDADVGDLFELAAASAQFDRTTPIILLHDDTPRAIVTIPALLGIAADLSRNLPAASAADRNATRTHPHQRLA